MTRVHLISASAHSVNKIIPPSWFDWCLYRLGWWHHVFFSPRPLFATIFVISIFLINNICVQIYSSAEPKNCFKPLAPPPLSPTPPCMICQTQSGSHSSPGTSLCHKQIQAGWIWTCLKITQSCCLSLRAQFNSGYFIYFGAYELFWSRCSSAVRARDLISHGQKK